MLNSSISCPNPEGIPCTGYSYSEGIREFWPVRFSFPLPLSREPNFSQLFPARARARPRLLRPFTEFEAAPVPSARSPRGDGVGEWEPVSRRLGGGRALGRLHVQRQRLDLPREVGGPQLGNHLLRQHLPRHAHSLPG